MNKEVKLTNILVQTMQIHQYVSAERCSIECGYLPCGLNMVMQMNPDYLSDDVVEPNKTLMKDFNKRFRLLSPEELDMSLAVSTDDFLAMLSQMVSCISCRRSAEQLYLHMEKESFAGIYPLVVTSDGSIRVVRERMNSKFLFDVFYCQSKTGRIELITQSLAKAKSGRRCALHSIDSRVRPVSTWLDVWECMNKTCRQEVVVLEVEYLWETLQRYLHKHRFCTECKSKVQQAYRILVEEVDDTEPGYVPAVYEDIRCCKDKGHLHITCKTDYVSRLIAKAVPEIVGSPRRERHAKTMEIAQEEVLTCLGICLFDRLNRILQRFREEEQTWQIIMCVAVRALRQSFDVAVENKLGRSQLELFCEELNKEEQLKQQKKESKKQKRRRKKDKKAEEPSQDENQDPSALVEEDETIEVANQESHQETDSCQCVNEEIQVTESSGKKKKTGKKGKNKNENLTLTDLRNQQNSKLLLTESTQLPESTRSASEISRDCGYSSETVNDNASSSSSDIACSESFCNHNTRLCSCSENSSSAMEKDESCRRRGGWSCNAFAFPSTYLSLTEQLEDSCSSEEDEPNIPLAEASLIRTKPWQILREEERKDLLDRFNAMMNASLLKPSTFSTCDHSQSKSSYGESYCESNENGVSEQEYREKSMESSENGKTGDKSCRTFVNNSKSRAGGSGQVRRRYKGKNRR